MYSAVVFSYSFLIATLTVVGTSKELVIIDTDPGIDDALAIFTLLGDPGIEVLAITCVRGNTNVPQVALNTIGILQVANKIGIPVYSGGNFGLIDSPTSDFFFGENGFQNVSFPMSLLSKVQKEHAPSFLANIVENNPGNITILAIGPLTNIALAIELNPKFIQLARRVVVLGGCTKTGLGFSPPGLEFNFYTDSSAARVVLERTLLSNTSITLVTCDVVIKFDLTYEWRWNQIGKINNSVVHFLNELESRQQAAYNLTTYLPYDLFAAGVVISPDVVTSSQMYFGLVESEGLYLRGALTVDYRNLTKNAANIELVLDYDVESLKYLTFQRLSNF